MAAVPSLLATWNRSARERASRCGFLRVSPCRQWPRLVTARPLESLDDAPAGEAHGRERSLEKALAVARHQGVRLQELSAATSLAQLWQRQARREAALGLLGPIYAWLTGGFEYPDLRNARALLEELSKA
jgi:hypothetical protein